ncbi:SusC/RagA family TonB-linked outer membrane protein [Catalinimonas niigatensis]|uniref:SusC/RagA family TonB-linked outer membrane protein n=1 Tax=Catalinimonas niigatensis TaxID=1397264 RepID=UPI00266683BB|nr:TonB-dependent receptor [Catalinimonas niigatensis]WPP51109.1 TonB-dependent receptor [Catalinimonas niigatensis]
MNISIVLAQALGVMMARIFLLLVCITPAIAQEVTVSGRVTVAPDQEAVPGVNVVVKGTTQGTVTDIDGNYRISASDENDTLIFSFVGYANQEEPINGRSTIDVTLQEDVEQLSEVVVIGYGTQRKSDLTGAVSSIKAEEITKIGSGIPSEALQGKVAGVNVTPSGVPGRQPNVNIRGVGTLGNNNPLYVVDGVFLEDISFLNGNDIQSMEVLKDASATAIYGSRGANGVIIVTTKKGVSDEPSFSLNAYEGIQNVIYNDFSMVNAREYGQLINEGLSNTGADVLYNPDTLGTGTNWFDEIYRSAPMRDYQLSFNQKTERSSYFVSAGYFRQKGILKGSDFERYTLRLNNSYDLSDNVTIGHNVSASWFNTDNPSNGALQWAYRVSPIVPVYNEDGSFAGTNNSGAGNPVAAIAYNNNETRGQRIVGNAYADIDLWEDFTFRSSIGIDFRNNQNQNFTPEYFVSPTQFNQVNLIDKSWERWFDWLWENTLTWDKTIGNHYFNILGGITSQQSSYEILGGTRRNLASENPNLWYLNAGEVDGVTNQNYGLRNSIASYLFRANYTLMDRYLFTATFRADGSSRFPPGKRWGYFPSFALGWNISEENFLADAGWLDNLKLRASWGQIGNQNILDYQYYARAGLGIAYDAIFNNQLQPGSTITQLSNSNITWETATQTDVGLEMGFLNGALNVEVDYYHRTTDDILITVNIPGTVGLDPTDANVGSVLNKGFDFSVNYVKDVGDVSFNVGLVGTTISNEVTDLGGREEIIGGNIGAGNSVSRARVGQPIGFFYGYNVIGVFQNQSQVDAAPPQFDAQPGDLIFEDSNGDGEVNADDRVNIGSPIPKFTGGLNLGVSYKNFDFSVDFAGIVGNQIYNAKRQERYSGSDNFDEAFLDRWTGEGTSNTEPRMSLGAGRNFFVSSRFVEDGDFVKIRNMQLGYNLPVEVSERLSLQNVRIYVSGNNLIYFTKYNGFTPEIESTALYDNAAQNANDATGRTLGNGIDRTVYPLNAVYRVGLNVTF